MTRDFETEQSPKDVNHFPPFIEAKLDNELENGHRG